MQNRLKSWPAWLAVAGLFYFVAKTWFGFEIPGWDAFVGLVGAVGVAFGIFNNPTDKNNY